MRKGEISFRIGGAAGDGVASSAETFARICSRSGLHVSTYSFYQSIIRGGHVWTQVRASDVPIQCSGEDPDILVCLNQDTADLHAKNVTEGGAIVYDANAVQVSKEEVKGGVSLV